MKKKLISFIAIAACLFSFASHAQDAADAGNAGGDPACANEQTVTICALMEEGDFESCEPTTLCDDAAPSEGAAESDDSISSWILCLNILGTTGNDTIYLGSLMFYNSTGGYWYTLGDFGYCMNNVLHYCNFVADDLPVVGYAGSDTLGVPSTSVVCPSGSGSGITSWSFLRDEFRDTRLHIYGCQGNDPLLRGTPNNDTIIGGSGNDTIYGLDGADALCGDRYSSGSCSESSCTSDSGYGNDTIHGGSGDDVIAAGKGSDTVYGEGEDDTIYLGEPSLTGNCSANDDCTAYPYHNWANGGYGDDIIYGGQYCQNWMWGSYDNDLIYGCAEADRICGDGGLYDELHGQGGNDIVVDCLTSQETLPEDDNPTNCHVTLFGEAGDDVVCYKKVGTANGDFCLNGGDGSEVNGDKCTCNGESDCQYSKCENTTIGFSPDCDANGTFTCNCP